VAYHEYRTDAATAAGDARSAQSSQPVYWICLALLLATIALATRIAAIL
jgi:hypothetical protein